MQFLRASRLGAQSSGLPAPDDRTAATFSPRSRKSLNCHLNNDEKLVNFIFSDSIRISRALSTVIRQGMVGWCGRGELTARQRHGIAHWARRYSAARPEVS